MIGKAACRGAATIVNAIATGKGAAFGISLETDAIVEIEEGKGDVSVKESSEGHDLVAGCVRSIATKAAGKEVRGEVHIRSEIPISRGLKSSSAVSNAVVLATARALGKDVQDMVLILAGIEESVKAGVTVTGAFDDASACFMGGVVLTNNRSFTVLGQGHLDPDLEVLLHVPDRKITKASVKSLDFSPITVQIERAFDLAIRGEYLKAMELNSKAYAKVLDVSEEVAEAARLNGALGAGISGTGPATTVVCSRTDVGTLTKVLGRFDGSILRARINNTPAKEVAPRLF